jgi:hypothetical protein
MPTYARSAIKTNIATKISGTISDGDLNTILNEAVKEVVADVDLYSMKRRTLLAPNLFDDIFDYTCPTDFKALVDVQPQIKRGKLDEWRLTTPEEFDRLKEDMRVDRWGDPIRISRSQWLGDSIVAIDNRDSISKIRLSRPVDDHGTTIDDLDAVGGWLGFGDGTNLTADSDNYMKGSASLNWDINAVGGTTAGVYNASLAAFDITSYLSGSIFVWVYITSVTNITNFKIRIGSGAGVYNEITVTTTNEATAFVAGWNLLRFDFINKTVTGSPVNTACTYVALFMTKAGAKISETDYRFDWLVMKRGDYYYTIYYSKYGWQTAVGAWLENATQDTDLVNADTDELRLIELKATELGEEHLHSGKSDKALAKYQIYIKKYEQTHPSDALIMTNTYHFLNF